MVQGLTVPVENPENPLAGRQALVTGAGSGIGRAVALALAERGMRLLLVGRCTESLNVVAEQADSGGVSILSADIATEPGRAAVAAAVSSRLHVLVHSAGAYLRGPVATVSGSAWAALDAVNLHAPVLLTAACLPALRAGEGDVVFVNSTAGLRAGPNVAAYAAGKHGLRAAADALRQEVNADGVRVLSIFPGRTDTPMQAAVLAQEGRTAAPGTLLRPEDVAGMIVAALMLPRWAEVTEIAIRPARPLYRP
jgi:NADP-dependent 3-hydroxy acid dehydrogenase YdfG